MDKHTLLIECGDEKGLIHKITGVLYNNNLNVTSNAEFVDKAANRFFMRSEIPGELDAERIVNGIKALLPKGAVVNLSRHENKKVILLATKEHHCLSDLLIRNFYKELNIEIQAVVSNYNSLEGLTTKFGIPFHFISHEGITREEHESKILTCIKSYKPEYLVLAKYMRVLSAEFVSNYKNRIINIHHSFLPAFIGANPYVQAYERGVKIIGATAHFVTNDLDQGPIIAQNVIPVAHSHSAADMSQAGKDVEKIVLAKALKLVLEERVFVSGNKTVIFD